MLLRGGLKDSCLPTAAVEIIEETYSGQCLDSNQLSEAVQSALARLDQALTGLEDERNAPLICRGGHRLGAAPLGL